MLLNIPLNTVIAILIVVPMIGTTVYLTVLLIRALRKCIHSKEIRQERNYIAESLGEVIKSIVPTAK